MEHFFQSKWIIINRRLLRRCNSISDKAPQLKSSFGIGSDLTSLQNKLSNLTSTFKKVQNIFKQAISAVRVLIKDVSEILGNRTLEKKNMLRIVRNLLEMTIQETLTESEMALKDTLDQDSLEGKIRLEQEVFAAKSVSRKAEESPRAKLGLTPQTVVKAQRPFLKKKPKICKKIKKVDAKALEELMDQKGVEVRGLRDILRKSKKGFKDFLRSFGWSDHDIEDAMRTASVKESPRKAKMIRNKKKDRKSTGQLDQVQSEYQVQGRSHDHSKPTFTKNIVIKEYIPNDIRGKVAPQKTQSDFFSKQTNHLAVNPTSHVKAPTEK